MASTDAWSDFETLRHTIKHNTVDKLKHILTGFNDECGTILFKSGKKQDLIDRIIVQLDSWRNNNSVERWIKAKAVLYLVRNSGVYHASRMPAGATAQALPPVTAHNAYAGSSGNPNNYHIAAGPNSIGRYDPYAPPRRPGGSASMAASTSSGPKPGIRFKPSPFLRIDQVVSTVVECPESSSASDRRQQTVTFTLNNDHLAKLRSASPKYQLRLYCTSSSFYATGPTAFRTNTGSCPIEFPPTCEVRVNNVQLGANLKGLKKKPGTAPPPDLGKAVRVSNVHSNRVEIVYVNSQQPAQPKKYYMAVYLVEITSVDQLVVTLKKGKYRTRGDVLSRMVAAHNEDDDIVAGPQKMSLKCPLSFIRVSTPCRSSKCVHSQCFDATSWFSVMEQTTTWLCPVCEKVLNFEDLIIDGYFDEILNQTPDSVEDVVVEADGEWHTGDNKYASARWKLSHAVTSVPKAPLTPRKSMSVVKSPFQTPAPTKEIGKGKASNIEIVILDSDDEDEGRVKRELSPSFASGSSGSAHQSFDASVPLTQTQSDDVIDLTLDSDDEEPAARQVSTAAEKRKATDAEVSYDSQPWKKARTNEGERIHNQMAIRTITNGPINGTGPSAPSPSASTYHTNGVHYPSYPGQRSPTQLTSSRPTTNHVSLAGRYPQYLPSHPSLHRSTPPTAPRGGSNSSSPHTSTYPYSAPRINGSSSASRWP